MAQAVLGTGAAILVWRSRALQVFTFVAAAGLGRWRRSFAAPRPASRSSEWSHVQRPRESRAPLNPLVLVTYHPEYHSFDPSQTIECLIAATRLGVGWLRTDLRWHEILPDGIHPDSRALAWYRDFLDAASDCGLRNMVVLSSPPRVALRQSNSGRLDAWSRFVQVVVGELGKSCDTYQLMNEPNNPLYRFFSINDAAIALVRGASIIRAGAPAASVAINIAMEIWGWRDYLQKILQLSGRSVDIVGLDHYPGTWTVGLHERWSEVIELGDVIASATPTSPWSNRHLMIMETGFATNTPFRDQTHQSKYFEHVLGVAAQLRRRSAKDTPLIGIYELSDWDTSAWLDPEAHFGLLNCDLEPKISFEHVTQLIASL